MSSMTRGFGTFENAGAGVLVDWLNPANAGAQDGQYAAVALGPDETSSWLIARAPTSLVPAGSVMEGRRANLRLYGVGGAPWILGVVLVLDGHIVSWEPRPDSQMVAIPDELTTLQFGGATDGWGYGISDEAHNAAGYGFAVQVQNTDGALPSVVYVDLMNEDLWYHARAGSAGAPLCRSRAGMVPANRTRG